MAWDLSIAAADTGQSFAVTTQDGSPAGVAFSVDGSKMFMLGGTNDRVYEYALSTPWDLTTASYSSVSFSVAGQTTGPLGIYFKPDGTKFWIADFTNDRIWQYDLSAAWDISTASYSGISKLVSAQDGTPSGVWFKPDGTKMFFPGASNDRIYEYALSTPWDVSTASFTTHFAINTLLANPRSVWFRDDGLRVYTADNSGTMYQFVVGTAWDLSTATTTGGVTKSMVAQDNTVEGTYPKPDGTKFFMIGNTSNRVYRYDLGPGAGRGFVVGFMTLN